MNYDKVYFLCLNCGNPVYNKDDWQCSECNQYFDEIYQEDGYQEFDDDIITSGDKLL